MPIPRGGGQKLADALVGLIRANGGTCETGVHVERVFTGAVRTADGETVTASRAVVCNVTPTQLYGDLLEGHAEKTKGFRYGRSEMQIHYALSEPPRWEGDERLAKTAIVHLTRPRRRIAAVTERAGVPRRGHGVADSRDEDDSRRPR